ncbi:MAG: hypothetical protein LCH86_09775 [Proteobacteria bacterium]|nr:hypothetical protein [Pseudomonadota bacterium]
MSDTISYATKLEVVRGIIQAKQSWLEDHSTGSRKRPDHEIEHYRHQVAVLNQIEADYRKAVDVEARRTAP